jgi:hypothetical protein
MRIHWNKIKEGQELFAERDRLIYFVPSVGRVYVRTQDERRAAKLGGNPVCHLESVSAPGAVEKLYMISLIEDAPLESPE